MSLVIPKINAARILIQHYKPELDSKDIPETSLESSKDINITNLLKEKSPRCAYFVDTHKQKVKCWVNMIDITQEMALPLHTSKMCWWHRDKINHRPLGIPVTYSAHRDDKNRVKEKFKDLNYNSDTNDFFETVGTVCSFPCMKAYILDQLSKGNSARFKDSLTLMTLLYSKIFGKIITIPTAPTWKLLKQYGGHLTPEEYTSTFGRLEYTETVNVRRPYMFSSSEYIQEHRVRF